MFDRLDGLDNDVLKRIIIDQRNQISRLAAQCRKMEKTMDNLWTCTTVCAGATIAAAIMLIVGVLA